MMLRRLSGALGALVVAFHVWLLAGQAWSGELWDAGLLARWILTAGVIAALLVLRRRGASVLWGRRAVAVWLFAALLHAPAVAERVGLDPQGLPEAAVALTQVTVGAIALVAIVLIAWRHSRRRLDAT